MKSYITPGEEWRNLVYKWKLFLNVIKEQIDAFDQDRLDISVSQLRDTTLWKDFADFDMNAIRIRNLYKETLKIIRAVMSEKPQTNC